MSNVKELADREAARAEAETPDEETADADETAAEEEAESVEGTPEPDAEPAPEVNSDAQAKAIVSELGRHERAWAKLNGVEPDELNVCPTCEGVGFTMEPQPQIKEAEYAERCMTCNGYGEVLSGSLRQGSQTVKCLACAGLGYIDKRNPAELVGNGAQVVQIEPVSEEDPEAKRLRDLGYTVFKAPPVHIG